MHWTAQAGRSRPFRSAVTREAAPVGPASTEASLALVSAACPLAPSPLCSRRIPPDPNGQSGKLSFLNQQTDAQGYLTHVVQQPLSPYELKKGSVIPATMITGV